MLKRSASSMITATVVVLAVVGVIWNMATSMPTSSTSFGQYTGFSLPPYDATRPEPGALEKMFQLPQFIKTHGKDISLLTRIFKVEEKSARQKIPDEFVGRALELFAAYPQPKEKAADDPHGVKFLEKQTVLTTFNRYTQEYSMFNEVRRYRPGYREKLTPDMEIELEKKINATMGDHCDFCKMRTAVDIFGRTDGKHCFIASNIAKFDKWHGLLVSKVHHPLQVDRHQMHDYLDTAWKWFQKVHAEDKNARFPHLMWDSTPKASASQMHQHMHVSLTSERYWTRAEQTRQSAVRYSLKYPGSNFWSDIAAVHERLGLAVRYGRCILLSYICPIKERELIVLGPSATDPSFAKLIAVGLQSMRDDIGTRAFSMGIIFEPIQHKNGPQTTYPAIARMIDRGSPLDARGDTGSMEFYGANNVGGDPFQIAPFLHKRVAQLSKEDTDRME